MDAMNLASIILLPASMALGWQNPAELINSLSAAGWN